MVARVNRYLVDIATTGPDRESTCYSAAGIRAARAMSLFSRIRLE